MEFKEDKEYGLVTNDEYVEKPTKNKLIASTFLLFGFVAVFVWWTFSMYNDFKDLENNVRDIEVNSIVYLLYEIGGKWFALLFPVGGGILFLVIAIKGINKILNKDYEQ